MSRSLHKILNTVLPRRVRTGLRRAALQTIPSMRHLDMPARLKSLARAGCTPTVIADIGAAHGEFAQLARSIWPDAQIVGFEPNSASQSSLERLKQSMPRFDFIRCFLGPEPKDKVQFAASDTQTSLLMHQPGQVEGANATDEAPMFSIDSLVASGRIPQPDFLKLDVQGFELEVLKGAEAALAKAKAVCLEVSAVRFAPGVPVVADVVNFMAQRQLVLYDIVGILRRLDDDSLYQLDLVFVPANSKLVRHEPWSE